MIDSNLNPADADIMHNEVTSQEKSESRPVKSNMSKSMHDGVEVWCDCCSCEAEPYWVEAMQDYDDKP